MKDFLLKNKNTFAWSILIVLALILIVVIFQKLFKGTGYQFFHGMDSSEGDIDYRPDLANDVAKLMLECNKNKECVAFNTEGWLKATLKPKSEWKLYMTTKDKGLYVSKSYLKNLNK